MTVKDALLREINTLPDAQQAEVLTFVRYLRVTRADDGTLRQRFDDAVSEARRIAAERGITEQDIAEEIRAVREGR